MHLGIPALLAAVLVFLLYFRDPVSAGIVENFSLHPALEYGERGESVPSAPGSAYAAMPGLPSDGPLPWLFPEDPMTMKGPRRGDGTLVPEPPRKNGDPSRFALPGFMAPR